MKRIVILSLLAAALSGCVVVPGGYYSDDGYRHEYHGYYGHGYYGGYRGSSDHGQ